MNNKGADQTVLMYRLVCTFVICMQQNQIFSQRGSNDVDIKRSGVKEVKIHQSYHHFSNQYINKCLARIYTYVTFYYIVDFLDKKEVFS